MDIYKAQRPTKSFTLTPGSYIYFLRGMIRGMIRGNESLKSNFQPRHQEVHAKQIQTHTIYIYIYTEQPCLHIFQHQSLIKDNSTDLPTVAVCANRPHEAASTHEGHTTHVFNTAVSE